MNAEFWRGVLIGMKTVKADIGDPIAHLIQHGVWQVKSVIRHELAKRVTQSCATCCKLNTKYSYKRLCETCGGNVENVYRIQPMENEDMAEYVRDIASTSVEELKSKADAKFHRLIEAIYDGCEVCEEPESPMSYAANKLGVSKQRVSFLVGQMRKRLSQD